MARIVVPGIPHHITQRGNRRQHVFFSEDDYQYYYLVRSYNENRQLYLIHKHQMDLSGLREIRGGVSAGGGSVGGNFGTSKGSGDYKQTQVSSIIGTESVDINVDGKLSMTGSIIANATVDEKGNILEDKGNLNLVAGSFEWADLTDYSKEKQSGFNMGTSIGYTGGTTTTSEDGLTETRTSGEFNASGSTTVGITSTGSETEGITRATIGNGNVTIKDGTSLDGLNRDVAMVQETTKDLITGTLDSSFNVDNRLFSEVGRTSWVENTNESFTWFADNADSFREKYQWAISEGSIKTLMPSFGLYSRFKRLSK